MFRTAARAAFFLRCADVPSARIVDNNNDETLFDKRDAQDSADSAIASE
jgi:hypothetical protein